MTNTLYRELEHTPLQTQRRTGLGCEAALRVAAAALSQATSLAVGATRVVVADVPEPDSRMFETVVSEIATEFGLGAEILRHDGAATVRFTRATTLRAPKPRERGLRSMLAGLFAA